MPCSAFWFWTTCSIHHQRLPEKTRARLPKSPASSVCMVCPSRAAWAIRVTRGGSCRNRNVTPTHVTFHRERPFFFPEMLMCILPGSFNIQTPFGLENDDPGRGFSWEGPGYQEAFELLVLEVSYTLSGRRRNHHNSSSVFAFLLHYSCVSEYLWGSSSAWSFFLGTYCFFLGTLQKYYLWLHMHTFSSSLSLSHWILGWTK